MSGRSIVQRVRRLVDHGDAAGHTDQRRISEQLLKGQSAQVQVIVDASNSNTALVSLGYVNQIASKFATDYQVEMLTALRPAIADSGCRRSCWSGSRGSIPICAASGILCRE